jgi:hypothetical protein
LIARSISFGGSIGLRYFTGLGVDRGILGLMSREVSLHRVFGSVGVSVQDLSNAENILDSILVSWSISNGNSSSSRGSLGSASIALSRLL